MEAAYATHQASAPFFYYNPDPSPEQQKHHGHFSSHPAFSAQMQEQQFHCHEAVMTTISRPSSADSQNQMQQKVFGQGPSILTPMASPGPLNRKNTLLFQDRPSQYLSVDTECIGADVFGLPATPPLSTSGSAISSPPMSSGLLPTPNNDASAFFALESIEGVKEGCQGDVRFENLAGGDWSRSGSPPMTPGKFLILL